MSCASGSGERQKSGNGGPLVDGLRVTGFSNPEEAAVGLTDIVPFLLEDRLEVVRAWLRSQRQGSIAALETLRVCLIAAVLLLLQPERVVTQEPEQRAVIAVLWDDSGGA